ncbi:MAG: 5-deoxy-glucuronate isomerase [Anaerolineales bacterium]
MSAESKLLVRPTASSGEYIRITPERAGWELLHFAARKMTAGELWEFDTGESEFGVVVLGGTCAASTSDDTWGEIGRRPNVFAGMPYTLYLPRRTEVQIEATSEGLDLGYGWCDTDQDHPARLITPEDVHVELRGGGNATRQINDMIPPGFDCHRLVVVEVYTPSGNWSSYPPHKHDVHQVSESGDLIEADLEETYFYKQDRPEGFAIQRVYTGDGSLNEIVLAQQDDVVLVPEGYHPVVSAHGYTTYYLNFLAGSAQSLANTDDPEFTWVKETWEAKDPRLPIVSMEMES